MFTDKTEYAMATAFNEYVVNLVFASYSDNRSLAVQAIDTVDGSLVTTLTVNLSNGKADRTKQYVDTNNCPWAPTFLAKNGIAKPTGEYAQSGFCTYPLYEFNVPAEAVEEIW